MYKFLVLSLIMVSTANAEDPFKDFTGQYSVGGATILDAPENEPKDTHIYFRIEGDAAKNMYSMITSKPIIDLCLDDGTLLKQAKNIQCNFDPNKKDYICYFSIGVNSNKIGIGVVC